MKLEIAKISSSTIEEKLLERMGNKNKFLIDRSRSMFITFIMMIVQDKFCKFKNSISLARTFIKSYPFKY